MPALHAVLLAAAWLCLLCSAQISFSPDELNRPVLKTHYDILGGHHPCFVQFDNLADDPAQGWQCSIGSFRRSTRDPPGPSNTLNMPVCSSTRVGAAFTFTWAGAMRAWYFRDGKPAGATSWNMTFDGSPLASTTVYNKGIPAGDMSYYNSLNNTFYGNHQDTVTLVTGESNVIASRIMIQVRTDAKDVQDVVRTFKPFVSGGALAEPYKTTGQWTVVNSTLLAGQPGASITLPVAANTSFVVVNGTSVSTYVMRFQTAFEPELPTWYVKDAKVPQVPAAGWNTVMVATVLEPRIQYAVTFTVPSDAAGPFILSGMTTMSAFNSTSQGLGNDGGGLPSPTSSTNGAMSGAERKAHVGLSLLLLPLAAVLLV